jgi:hypothetical protein
MNAGGTSRRPDTPCSGLHPLHAASRQQAPGAIRVFISGPAFEKIGQGRDARMGMQPKALERDSIVVEKIKEDERL